MPLIPEYVKEQARLELARRNFWDYCKIKAPDFYKEDRLFLKEFCYKLQDFFYGTKKILIVNMPPRHGKSRTIGLFVQWILGLDNKQKIMTGSYNEKLSGTFAKQVRDSISEINGTFQKVFPQTDIKPGEAQMNKWALKGNEEANYLATSPTGTSTGFGCTIMVIDDTIKEVAEAYNDNRLQDIIDWFENTMLQRTEVGFKIIIVMTRWARRDLSGHIEENYKDVDIIKYKAVQDDGTMLCSEILPKEEYEFKITNMNKDIVYANYQQEPLDIKGKLYTKLLTYAKKPVFKYIMNYTDTADEGDDYLCSINYGVDFNNNKYILDILYTKDPMEVTEPAVAMMLTKDRVGYSKIESNNGGRGFARAVQRELKDMKNSHTKIDWFHQTENKQSRIYSNSTAVMNKVLFPVGWENLYPEFYKSMNTYQKEGKNAHDDAQDTVTGVYENSSPKIMQLGHSKVIR